MIFQCCFEAGHRKSCKSRDGTQYRPGLAWPSTPLLRCERLSRPVRRVLDGDRARSGLIGAPQDPWDRSPVTTLGAYGKSTCLWEIDLVY
jgi:hypothetical protein